jgi:hypothetical protein
VAAARVILVSDSHLSGDAPQARANWDAVVSYVTAAAPDLVLARRARQPRHRRQPVVRRPRGHHRGRRPAAAMAGHRRRRSLDRTDHLWVPTTWAVLPDQVQPVLGVKRCGIVSLTFDAGAKPRPELIEPPGLGQFMITRDLPDPYHT